MTAAHTRNTKGTAHTFVGWALIFSVMVPQFGMNAVAPALPQIGQDFGVQPSSLQFIITVYLIGYAFSMLGAGFLAERFGARRTQLWCVFLFSLTSIWCAFETSFPALVWLRFVQALFGCGVTVLSRLLVAQIFPESRHLSLVTALALAVAVSPSVAPLIGGWLLVAADWRGIFLFLAGLGFSSFLLFFFLVPVDRAHASSFDRMGAVLSSCWKDVCNQHFRRYLLAISLVSMSQIAFIANSSYPMQVHLGLSASHYGLLLGLVALGFIIGTQITRWLVPTYGIDWMLAAAGLTTFISAGGIVTAVTIWPDSPLSLAIPMFVVMLGVGMVVPASQAGLLGLQPKYPGYLASVFFFSQIALSTGYGMGMKAFELDEHMLAAAVALPCFIFGATSMAWIWRRLHLSPS